MNKTTGPTGNNTVAPAFCASLKKRRKKEDMGKTKKEPCKSMQIFWNEGKKKKLSTDERMVMEYSTKGVLLRAQDAELLLKRPWIVELTSQWCF